MEPRLRACPEQFALLIRIYGKAWRSCKTSIGCTRSPKEQSNVVCRWWCRQTSRQVEKVWVEWKIKTKKKHLDIRYHASSTGGGPSSRHCLTPFEEKVISVLGVSAVSGQLRLQERGFNTAAPPAIEYAAIEYAFDVEDVVVEVPHTAHHCNCWRHHHSHPHPLLHFRFLLLLSHRHHYHRHSPLCPPSPSFLPSPPSYFLPPQPSSLFPPPPSSRGGSQKRPSPRQRSATTFGAPIEPRRNRGLTPFDRTSQMFAAVEQRRLDLEERRLVLEDERERRRLDFDVE